MALQCLCLCHCLCSVTLCMAAMRWPLLQAPAATQDGLPCCTAHRALALEMLLCRQNVLSCSASGHASTNRGRGWLPDRHACFPAQPLWGGLSSSSPQGPADSQSPRAPSSKGRCAQGLCASTDIPCQRPRGHCRGLQAWAHKPGTTAQPHCPELGGSWHLGRHQHPAQSAQKQEDKNSPNKA